MTADKFELLYPELSQSFVNEQINSKIRLANLLINKMGNFGDSKDDAIALLVAHLLTIGKMAGTSGSAVQTKTSKKVGEVSYTYATESGDRGWYHLSSYGQDLLFLIDLQPKYSAAFVV